MSYLKKTLLTLFFSMFLASNLLAVQKTKDIEIDFSLLGFESAFDGQTIFWGTFVFKKNDVQVDQGFFTDLNRPFEGNDNCNGNSFNNHQVIVFYGENGISELILEGRSALGKNSTLQFKKGSGVYTRLGHSNDVTVVADCSAPSNQYVLTATVTVNPPPCNCNK